MQPKRTQQDAMCTQYTRYKYIEHVLSKPTTTNMREIGIDKYANSTNVPLQKTSSDWRRAHVKRKDKTGNSQ